VIITAFVLVVLAVAFLVAISDQTNVVTTKTSVASESHDTSAGLKLANILGLDYTATHVQVNISNTGSNLTVTNAPTSWKTEDCPLTNVVVTNGSGTVYTLNTDYTLDAVNGKVALLNTTATQHLATESNSTLVSYTYCSNGYVNSSWGRSLLGVNIGLYAIAVLVIAVGLVYLLLNRKEDED